MTTKTEHNTIQSLIDKFVAIEKRATRIETAEELECICDDTSPYETIVGWVRQYAEELKKGELKCNQ